jgi:hypothetical protein
MAGLGPPLGGDVPAEIERGVAEDLVDHVALAGGHCRSFHHGGPGRMPRRPAAVVSAEPRLKSSRLTRYGTTAAG